MAPLCHLKVAAPPTLRQARSPGTGIFAKVPKHGAGAQAHGTCGATPGHVPSTPGAVLGAPTGSLLVGLLQPSS